MLMQHSKKAEAYMETDTLWVLCCFQHLTSEATTCSSCRWVNGYWLQRWCWKQRKLAEHARMLPAFLWVLHQHSFLGFSFSTFVPLHVDCCEYCLLWTLSTASLKKNTCRPFKNKIRQKAFVVFCRATMGNLKKTSLCWFLNFIKVLTRKLQQKVGVLKWKYKHFLEITMTLIFEPLGSKSPLCW